MSGMPLCPTGIIKGAIHHVLKRTCFLARFQKLPLLNFVMVFKFDEDKEDDTDNG